jgi:hypothetical protein
MEREELLTTGPQRYVGKSAPRPPPVASPTPSPGVEHVYVELASL